MNERGDVIEIKSILAPTDFSAHSEQAVRYACRLAERLGSELHLLHVLSEILPAGPDPLLMPVMPAQFYKENEDRAQETLDRSLDPSWEKPAAVVTAVQLGQPGRVDRFVRRSIIASTCHHRHPRTDRPEPRPLRLGGRANRSRSPLPSAHDPRPRSTPDRADQLRPAARCLCGRTFTFAEAGSIRAE